MKFVYICTPETKLEGHLDNLKKYCRLVYRCGNLPIAPGTYFSQFIDEEVPNEKMDAIYMGLILMQHCSEVWVFATDLTERMKFELDKARELKIPIKFYDEGMDSIRVETIGLDNRLSNGLKEIIATLRYESKAK